MGREGESMKVATWSGMGVLLAGFFQVPSAPPMKAGLWESTTTLTIVLGGAKVPARAPIVGKTRSCVSAGSWAKAFANSGREGACTRINETFSCGLLSFDLHCPNVNGSGHGEMSFSGTSGHGRVHLDMKPGGQKVSSDTVIQSRYVGAACGAVAPGKPVVVE
jgi:hypothetical protein